MDGPQTNFRKAMTECLFDAAKKLDTQEVRVFLSNAASSKGRARASSHAKFASGKFCLAHIGRRRARHSLALGPDQNWFASADEFRHDERESS